MLASRETFNSDKCREREREREKAETVKYIVTFYV